MCVSVCMYVHVCVCVSPIAPSDLHCPQLPLESQTHGYWLGSVSVGKTPLSFVLSHVPRAPQQVDEQLLTDLQEEPNSLYPQKCHFGVFFCVQCDAADPFSSGLRALFPFSDLPGLNVRAAGPGEG